MRLPNAEQAVVEIVKLRAYCLNPEHIRGQHKARVFAAALDFSVDDAYILRELLFAAAQNRDAIPAKQDEYGQRYIIDFEVKRKDKQATIRSIWIIRSSEDFPRLTSCYVL